MFRVVKLGRRLFRIEKQSFINWLIETEKTIPENPPNGGLNYLEIIGFFRNYASSILNGDFIPKDRIVDIVSPNIERLTETALQERIIKNLSSLESGLTYIDSNVATEDGGFIDILARDKNNTLCIIEVKKDGTDQRLIFQTLDYPCNFNEPVRMITIAPYYHYRIARHLINIGHVEMYVIQIFGRKVMFQRYDDLCNPNRTTH